ncbi:NUDIX domain-containing protein [Thalassotalea sp. HSM 43]|uniref:NUDIX domain-containing protein n=1 Tax=Thalassotalea sp. HSM 43 TaxID=2552945 RepID=UPI001081CAC7|nr:NUDIX domain-containing protein [Thalassotalea sp. HSM 43]QBY04990.1 NUDIX domain-containing protein [Thalassotalea sp. HSM 43]
MNKLYKIKQFNSDDYIVEGRDVKYQGFFRIDQYQLKHKLFAGGESALIRREVFERGDAVVLIIFDKKQRQVLMIEQFRVGAIRSQDNPWLLEFVAGMFDQDEQPIDVAIREAKEEANIDITADECQFVCEFLPSPGGTSEKIYMYVAYTDLSAYQDGQNHGLADEHEDILVHKLPLTEALALQAQGKVNNASSIIGLQWLALQFGG